MAPWGGDPLNPKELGQLYDGRPEERKQLREMLAPRFQGENWNWFVHSIIELEKSAFYKPTEADSIERFAQRSNIQKAFEDAKGDVVTFAETLATLEGGRMDGKFMAETFDTFQNYAHLLSEMVRNEGEEVRTGGPHHLRRCRFIIHGTRMIESVRESVPAEWLEFAPLDAYNMQHIYLCEQAWQASVGRNSKTMDENLSSAAPMAMTPAGDVYAVIESDVKGFFTRTAHLTLKDGKNNTVKLKLPLASVMRGFEETAGWFLEWAKMCSPIIQPPGVNFVALPKWFFARNTSL